MKRARLLLGDDHTLMLEGLRKILEPEFEVAGTAGDGRALVREAMRLKPDVVLAEVSLPLLHGIEAARQIRKRLPGAKVVFLTTHADLTYLRDALRVGASGYILKTAAGKELTQAVRQVLRGRIYVTSELTRAVEDPQLKKALQRGRVPALTPRQREILRLVAGGRSDGEIAGILNIAVKTVRFHRSALARKLGITSTAALTRYALQHRIVTS
jgi:DNA-binding NarL/FixJ family response regulator